MIITKGIKAKLQPNLAQEKWLGQQFGILGSSGITIWACLKTISSS